MTQESDTNDNTIELPAKTVDPTQSLSERLTDNVQDRIGPARYFERDENGNPVENWAGVFNRVATNVAGAESSEVDQGYWSERFEQAMRELRFMPNSPTIMNAGLPLQQLSACFVVEPKDDMDDINETQTDAASIFKSGGGVGYAFHHLRPKGARVSSTGGVSSGPLSFMELFDTTCQTVKQGGKRRGAQMAIMHAHHPDVGRFVVSKRGEERFSNFNISIGITEDFRQAVENNETYTLYDPSTRPSENHDLRVGEAFDTVAETIHFYDPSYEDAWNDDFNKPGVGINGKPVEENFWRDYADQMPTDFSKFRDQINLEVGEPLELPARFIWQLLIDGAHNNGEPGIFNLDEVNDEHSFDVEEHPEHFIHSTNPCSEQPLEEYEACNLGHINLSLMVDEDAQQFDEWLGHDRNQCSHIYGEARAYVGDALDNDLFEDTIETGVRFLDNVVTQSEFPLDEITEQVESKRKIGLGLMGFHQMLIQMGVEYGSTVSYAIAEEIMRRIDERATEVSHDLAHQRGSFDEWSESKWSDPTEYPDWFRKHAHKDPEEFADGYSMRNHNVTTIAPTGTTSMIGNTTGGCEPIYQVAYFKNVGNDIQGDEMLVEFDDYFLRVLEHNDIDVDYVKEELTDLMMNNEFESIEDADSVPDDIAELFVTTQDLDAEQHIRMQAHFQHYCDSGISKTLNMPNDASVDEVGEAFMLALDLGIKGTTVYRDGSRDEQVKTTRVDNNLDGEMDDETIVEHLVDQRNLSVKAEHTLRDELDLESEEPAERTCEECGSGQLDLSEGCPICTACGYSPCS
jgi:adenosylcobalamin-dependent ribonucleoside-diphosphate reductase